jgi:hypothetical protein
LADNFLDARPRIGAARSAAGRHAQRPARKAATRASPSRPPPSRAPRARRRMATHPPSTPPSKPSLLIRRVDDFAIAWPRGRDERSQPCMHRAACSHTLWLLAGASRGVGGALWSSRVQAYACRQDCRVALPDRIHPPRPPLTHTRALQAVSACKRDDLSKTQVHHFACPADFDLEHQEHEHV